MEVGKFQTHKKQSLVNKLALAKNSELSFVLCIILNNATS